MPIRKTGWSSTHDDRDLAGGGAGFDGHGSSIRMWVPAPPGAGERWRAPPSSSARSRMEVSPTPCPVVSEMPRPSSRTDSVVGASVASHHLDVDPGGLRVAVGVEHGLRRRRGRWPAGGGCRAARRRGSPRAPRGPTRRTGRRAPRAPAPGRRRRAARGAVSGPGAVRRPCAAPPRPSARPAARRCPRGRAAAAAGRRPDPGRRRPGPDPSPSWRSRRSIRRSSMRTSTSRPLAASSRRVVSARSSATPITPRSWSSWSMRPLVEPLAGHRRDQQPAHLAALHDQRQLLLATVPQPVAGRHLAVHALHLDAAEPQPLAQRGHERVQRPCVGTRVGALRAPSNRTGSAPWP